MALPPTPPPKKKEPFFPDVPQEKKDMLFTYGILSFGAWLFYKNYKSPSRRSYEGGDKLYDEVKENLASDSPRDTDSLDISGRRLDQLSKSFDPHVIQKGIQFESQKTGGDELVARRVAIQNLTRDADYYDGNIGIDPESRTRKRTG